MKNFIIAAVIALALCYAADAYWYNGKYFTAVSSMISEIVHHFQRVSECLDKLPAIIDTLITAVRGGELDEQFAAATSKPLTRKAKKGA